MTEPSRDAGHQAIPLNYADAQPTGCSKELTRIVLFFCVAGAILFVGILILLPALGKPPPEAQKVKCASNLKNIGLAVQMYANSHDERFPATFDELLLTTDLVSDQFVCPESYDVRAPGALAAEQARHLHDGGHLSYIYVGSGLTTSVANADTVILAYEPVTNHGGTGANFLFADGHVQWCSVEESNELIAAIPKSRQSPARK